MRINPAKYASICRIRIDPAEYAAFGLPTALMGGSSDTVMPMKTRYLFVSTAMALLTSCSDTGTQSAPNDLGAASDLSAAIDLSNPSDLSAPDPLDKACTPTVVIQQEDTGAHGMIFNTAVPDPEAFVQATGRKVCRILYRQPSEVRAANKVTLILRDDPNVVANKAGDVGDITIVVSTYYLADFKTGGGDIRTELEGILTHEMTHMYQNDDKAAGEGTYANLGNVIEGVADFVPHPCQAGAPRARSR